MCDTSRYLVADPWFALTLSGGGMRSGMGSFADGEVAGFSTTTPNCANAVGVRSSMGIRIDGAGIDVGMLPVLAGALFALETVAIANDGEVELELGWGTCEDALR